MTDNDARGVGDVIATPAKRDIEAHMQGQVQLLRRSTDSSHTYPPRHDDSPTLSPPTVHRGSLSPPPSLNSMISSRRQRPSPAPLLPRSPMPPALNSPDPSSETRPAGARTLLTVGQRRIGGVGDGEGDQVGTCWGGRVDRKQSLGENGRG